MARVGAGGNRLTLVLDDESFSLEKRILRDDLGPDRGPQRFSYPAGRPVAAVP